MVKSSGMEKELRDTPCSTALFLTQYFVAPSEVFLYRQAIGMKNLRVGVAAYHRMWAGQYPFDPVYELASTLLPVRAANAGLKRLGMIDWWDGIEYDHRFKHTLRCIRPSIINTQGGWVAARLIKELERTNIPIVALFWGSDINASNRDKTYYARLQRVFNRAERRAFLSEYLRSVAISLGCPPENTYVVHPGIELPEVQPQTNPRPDKFRLLSIGRLTMMKGHRYLLHAIRILADRGAPVELTLIGDGELRNEIKAMATELRIEDRVKFLGALPSKETLARLSVSDALVLSSVRCDDGQEESFGVVLIEAGAYGKPVIGSRIGGISEIIEHEKTGQLVPEKDPEALANAIMKLIDDPELAAKMGAAGRKRVEKRFEINQQNAKFEQILLSTLNDRH